MSNQIPAWASTANYPAGGNPWSGTPTKVSPAYTYFTPGTTPSAQELNAMFNARDVALNAVGGTGGEVAAANFGAIQTLGNDANSKPLQIYTLCFDHVFEQWLIAIDGTVSGSGGTPALLCSRDGVAWKTPTSLSAYPATTDTPKAMAVYLSGTVAVYGDTGLHSGTTGAIIRLTQGAAPTATTTVQTFANRGGTLCQQGYMEYFWGANTPAMYFIGASRIGTRGAWIGFAASDSNDGQGTAGQWTDLHTSLPASFLTGTSLVYKWASAQSGNTLLIAQCGQLAGTDPSLLLKIDATGTMTDVTPSFIGGSTLVIRGIAYSATDALWGVIASDGAGNSYFYASPDLVNWTLILQAGGNANGLAVIGSTWVLNLSVFLGNPTDTTFYVTNVAQIFGVGAAPAICASTWPTEGNLFGNSVPLELRSSEVPPAAAAPTVVKSPQFAVATLNSNLSYLGNFVWQSLKAGHVPIVGASAVAPIAQLGWNTGFDQDFSKLATASFGVDGSITLGAYTWTKVRSANDRAALTNNNGTGLAFSPTASHSGGGIFIPLTSILPANVILWSTAFRVWVYIQSQNITNNTDAFVAGLAVSSTSVPPWYDVREGKTSGQNYQGCELGLYSVVSETVVAGSFSNVLVADIPALDSNQLRCLSGAYNAGAWPTEAGGLFATAAADAGTQTVQDPTTGSPVSPSNVGLVLYPTAGVTAALTFTIGRVRVDYKL